MCPIGTGRVSLPGGIFRRLFRDSGPAGMGGWVAQWLLTLVSDQVIYGAAADD